MANCSPDLVSLQSRTEANVPLPKVFIITYVLIDHSSILVHSFLGCRSVSYVRLSSLWSLLERVVRGISKRHVIFGDLRSLLGKFIELGLVEL